MNSPEKEHGFRKNISYQSLLLGGFTAIAAVLLVTGNLLTRDAIGDRLKEDLQDSLNQVIPSDLYHNDLLQNPLYIRDSKDQEIKIYRGFGDSGVSALAWEVSEQGYAGEIRILMGVDPEGKILGVRVIAHSETPGLGDKIEPEKDNWIFDFNSLSLGNPPEDQWAVKKDGGRFDAFSGATITPRAVVRGIKNGLIFFNSNRSKLIAISKDAVSFETAPEQD